jgi:hypothetical protein
MGAIGERGMFIETNLDHFHAERNHQGKANALLFPTEKVGQQKPRSRVRCRERLGRLLKYYKLCCMNFLTNAGIIWASVVRECSRIVRAPRGGGVVASRFFRY